MKSLSIFGTDSAGRLTMSLYNNNGRPVYSTGVKVLLDKIALYLLTTIGSSLLNPSLGSTVTSIKRTSTTQDITKIRALITSTLADIESRILSDQLTQPPDRDDQTLIELHLMQVLQDPTQLDQILVEILVKTKSNQSYILTV